jgi:hypothetical protein
LVSRRLQAAIQLAGTNQPGQGKTTNIEVFVSHLGFLEYPIFVPFNYSAMDFAMSIIQQSYSYDELPKDDTFRYLVLQPGAAHEPLMCSLITALIADTKYHAISYVWSTDLRDQKILCDGRDLMVTVNLFNALQCIRLPDRPLALWADSICINQEEKLEKGHQVSLMGKIYRSAKCVLIYIGSDDDGHAPDVCSLLDEVDETVQSACRETGITWDSCSYPSVDDPLLNDPRWDSLCQLLSQDWFKHGWVVQEVALAVQSEVLWGKTRFDWQKPMRKYLWLTMRAPETFYAKEFGYIEINVHVALFRRRTKDTTQVFYEESSWMTPSTLQTLYDAKPLAVKDSHDRIHAFMELSQDNTYRITVDPDYSLFNTYLEVYRQFAVMYIQSTKNTDLLDFVCHNDSLLSDSTSWVPRWDIRKWSLAQQIGNSSALQPQMPDSFEPLLTKDGDLKVRGVIIGTVRYVSELLEWETTTTEKIRRVWDCINTHSIESPYIASGTSVSHMLTAFLDAMGACRYEEDWL